jgi:ribosomal protein L35
MKKLQCQMSTFDIEAATYEQINRENSRRSHIEQQKSHDYQKQLRELTLLEQQNNNTHAQEMRELNKIKLTNEINKQMNSNLKLSEWDQEIEVLRREIESVRLDNSRLAAAIEGQLCALATTARAMVYLSLTFFLITSCLHF